MRIFLLCGMLVLAGCLFISQAYAAPPAEDHSIFQDVKAIEFPHEPSAKDLPMDWFSAPITEAKDLFCPLFLPYTVHAQGVADDPNLQFTFPALQYFLFKFMTNNNCSSSPAFIFRRTPEARKIRANDPKAVAEYIESWAATHCVTGDITITPQGCSGSMQIYDNTGKRIYEKAYPDPLPYFTLMARMVEDWMITCHQPVSDKLKAEMERPMRFLKPCPCSPRQMALPTNPVCPAT
jgi:hypothetical protein